MTTPRSFELEFLRRAPRWLQGTWAIWWNVWGYIFDRVRIFAELAVRARFAALTPPDALAPLGRTVDLERYPVHTDAAFRARTAAPWTAHGRGGTAVGIEAELQEYGIADVQVFDDWQGTFAPGDMYSRIWIVIGPDMPWTGLILGSFTLGGDTTLGSSATVQEVRDVKRIILRWKGAHAYPVRVVLDFTGALLGAISLPFPLGGSSIAWEIGKLMNFNQPALPFVMGGYNVE